MEDDLVAQFVAITNAEIETAQQYLSAADYSLESALELFFASGGVTGASQHTALEQPQEPEVRERIEATTDRLVDPDMPVMTDILRQTRRAFPTNTGVFNQGRDMELNDNMTTHERRLAELFRPPFDLIRDIGLDEAKEEAQEERKWILVNIQDPVEFSCQQVNRDLWRHESVKEIIRENFLFLQYDHRSYDGDEYSVLYPFEGYPHIAILDPWTGEQQKVWNKVPRYEKFIEDLIEFLGTADTNAQGAAERAAPRELSAASTATPGLVRSNSLSSVDPEDLVDLTENESAPHVPSTVHRTEPMEDVDPTALIEAKDIPEPDAGPTVTRIQIRLGDGRRIVRRFDVSSTVSDVYAFIKFAVPALQDHGLNVTADRRNLASDLHKTIDEANLKNSMVLVEAK